MDAIAVNRTLQAVRERRLDLRAAMVDLEEAAACPARGEAWAVAVHAALGALEGSLAEHVACAEGPDGVFDSILARSPRLLVNCRSLIEEHSAITDAAARVRGLLDSSPDEVREAVVTLLSLLARHRQRGADLMYEAFTVDIGGSD